MLFPLLISFVGTNEDEGYIVQIFEKTEPFKSHFVVKKPLRDRYYDDMIQDLKDLKKDVIENKEKYSSFTLFILSHGNEV